MEDRIDIFAHIRHTYCYSPEFFEKGDFDIAGVATPFDTNNFHFFIDQAGTRFGPSRVGLGSRISAPAYSVYRKTFNPYKYWAKLVDCGDPPVRPLDNKIVLERVIREHSIK